MIKRLTLILSPSMVATSAMSNAATCNFAGRVGCGAGKGDQLGFPRHQPELGKPFPPCDTPAP